VCNECDVLVIPIEKEFAEFRQGYPHKCIVDLVRQFSELGLRWNYEGISWGNINGNVNQGMRLERDMATTEF
jgi:hypothetical protein